MSRKIFNQINIICLQGIFLVSLSGCLTRYSTLNTITPSPESLKIGVLAPFTGPDARIGDEFKGAVKMAFEKINYMIGPYHTEIVWIDEQSDPENATRAYEEAVIGQHIQVGLLNSHSSTALAVMDIAAKYKIPHFFGYGATNLINEKFTSDPNKYGYWVAKAWPIPSKLSIAFVSALEDALNTGTLTMPDKGFAIWGEDSDWGRGFGESVKKQFEDSGWHLISEDYVNMDQTDFLPLLNRYKKLNVPLVIGTSTIPPSITAFVKQADDVGLKSLIIANGLGYAGEWYDLTGSSSDYVIDQIPGWTTEKAKSFEADFRNRWGYEPSPSVSGLAYDYTCFFIEILQSTLKDKGRLTSETIFREAQEKLWTGQLTYTDGIIMSKYQYLPETIPDPVVGENAYIFPVIQYLNGKSTIVWPKKWKTGELQIKP